MATFACYGIEVARAEDPPEKAAQKVAEAWMLLWDSGQLEESYQALAQQTREDNTLEWWSRYWRVTRKALGKVKSRKLIKAEYTESLPKAPDTEGVSLLYESSFEKMKSISETFILTRKKGDTWRVAYYFPE
jgi:hypothetical protein